MANSSEKVQSIINLLASRLDESATRSLFPVMWSQLQPTMKLKIKDHLMQCLNNTNLNASAASQQQHVLDAPQRAARFLGVAFAIEQWENVLPSLLHAMVKGGNNAKLIAAARNANMAIRAIIEELVRILRNVKN